MTSGITRAGWSLPSDAQLSGILLRRPEAVNIEPLSGHILYMVRASCYSPGRLGGQADVTTYRDAAPLLVNGLCCGFVFFPNLPSTTFERSKTGTDLQGSGYRDRCDIKPRPSFDCGE